MSKKQSNQNESVQTVKRKYKDSLFVHLFCTDKDGPKNFLDLYNALNGTNLSLETTAIKDVHIEGVLYAGQENDVSFLVDNKVVMLCEQQSTVNKNMPLRCLMYIAKIYEQQLPSELRFKRKVQKIPKPQFFVFYNGREAQPEKQTLSLHDAFSETDISLAKADNTLFDLSVTVYNINNPTGKAEWEKSRALLDYSRFVNLVNEEQRADSNGFMERAIRRAIEDGIMSDYLRRNAKEIQNMFFGEYDYDMDIAVQRGEAYEDGFAEGEARGESRGVAIGERNKALETAHNLLNMGLSTTQIAQATGLAPEEIESL